MNAKSHLPERIAYRRERNQSLAAEIGSVLSTLLSAVLGYQRELTLSCVAELRASYGPTEDERKKGARMKKFINNLPWNKRSEDHCGEALRNHVETWNRLQGIVTQLKNTETV